MTNRKLNELSRYKNMECVYCGRKFPKTILNIEAVIHHHNSPRCLDLKSCGRYQRRKRRKISKKKT